VERYGSDGTVSTAEIQRISAREFQPCFITCFETPCHMLRISANYDVSIHHHELLR
jgi:hypothetical protein